MFRNFSWRSLRVPALLGCIFVLFSLSYYFFWVESRQQYLISRNFRVLANIGAQIDESINSQAKILELNAKTRFNEKEARQHVPKLYKFYKITPEGRPLVPSSYPATVKEEVKIDSIWSSLFYWDHNESGDWLKIRILDQEGVGRYEAVLRLIPLLSEILQQESIKRLVFDKVVLATADGRVIYQGDDSELRLTRLDRLISQEAADKKSAPFEALARSTNAIEVTLSGAKYHLFIQPFQTSLRATKNAEKDSEAESSLIICGLVSKQKFTFNSLAISFSFMATITALILLTIFSWPFLKLSLIGEHQRVRTTDVWLVGLCCLLITALVTIFWLDYWAYSRIKTNLDSQLAELADNIQANVKKEVKLAYRQLQNFRDVQPDYSNVHPDSNNVQPDRVCQLIPQIPAKTKTDNTQMPVNCQADQNIPGEKPIALPFSEWFLIHRKDSEDHSQGESDLKCRWDKKATPPVFVKDRGYFKEANAEHLWPAPEEDDSKKKYVLESIRSWTTGAERAVITAPCNDNFIAAVSVDLRSLIRPVLPPDFGYAVIDADGKVLFHTDSKRNLVENFFAETEGSRHLKAAVKTRRDEYLDLRYWGQNYRAYITPLASLPETPWYLVTFADKQPVRTLNVEWLVTTNLFLALYAGVYILIGLVIVFLQPAYRPMKLWPDRALIPQYRRLSWQFLLILLGYGLVIFALREWLLILAAGVIPFAVLIYTYVTLGQTQPASGSGSPPSLRRPGQSSLFRTYLKFGMLLLLLVAVMPAIGFFKTAYDLQIETYLKYTQLQMILGLEAREQEIAERVKDYSRGGDRTKAGELLGVYRDQNLDVYQNFFYGLHPATPGERSSIKDHINQYPTLKGDLWLPDFVRSQLSSYSELAVLMRELMSHHASDNIWQWRRLPENQLWMIKDRAGARKDNPPNIESSNHPAIDMSKCAAEQDRCLIIGSSIPELFTLGGSSKADWSFHLATATGMILVLGGLIWLLVRFICLRIFLIDVGDPRWFATDGALPLSTGQNLFLVYKDKTVADRYRGEPSIDFAAWACQPNNVQEWRDRLREVVERTPPGQHILIDHFEEGLSDCALNEQKLAILEELTGHYHRSVVILSRVRPKLLFSAARIMNGQTGNADGNLEERWQKMRATFSLVEADRLQSANQTAPELVNQPFWRRLKDLIKKLWTADNDKVDSALEPIFRAREALFADQDGNANNIDRNELNQDFDESAAGYYHDLWETCNVSEKVVLMHLAEDGFVNRKDRSTIRRLLARQLIQRQPYFRLTDAGFRRFILSPQCRKEVMVVDRAQVSAWDSVKWPFMIVLLLTITFFFVTQQELFNTTVAIVTGVTGALPAFIKLIGVLSGKRSEDGDRK